MACSTEDVFNAEESTLSGQVSMCRSVEDAMNIAQSAICMIEDVSTRSTGRVVDASNLQYVVAPATKGNAGNDTLLYIVNFANEEGFAVISANKNAEGLLAVIEKGSYQEGKLNYAENKGFTDFMEWAKEYNRMANINAMSEGGVNALVERKTVVDTLSSQRINTKVEVQWGQTGIEGTYAPNKTAGCSNTAMAQIMSYFCFPLTIAITYDGATINSQTLDWTAMKEHKITHYKQTCPASVDAHEAIAQLHRQLGELNKSDYMLIGGTATYASNVRESFVKLGYQASELITYKDESLYQTLSDGKLIYMRGEDEDAGGHAWVVDGDFKYTIHTTEWIRRSGERIWTLFYDYGNITREYIHINWGWDGTCNGLFYLGRFSPSSGYNYDNSGNNSQPYEFTEEVAYFTVSH